MKHVRRALLLVIVLYLGCLLFVAARQDRMIYQPEQATEQALLKRASVDGLEPWKNAQGETVAWHLPNPTAKRRIIVVHGGAGYALHRPFYASGFHQQNWDVWLFEYPGYGARAGTPHKASFISAARALVEDLHSRDPDSRDPRPLYLFGESLGSGTVCAVAGALPDKIAGVALMVPFARLSEVGSWHFPILPISMILHADFDNIAALASYRGPLVVIVAENDEIVGPEQGRKLHAAYGGPKHLISLPTKHADFPTDPGATWWQPLSDFLATKN